MDGTDLAILWPWCSHEEEELQNWILMHRKRIKEECIRPACRRRRRPCVPVHSTQFAKRSIKNAIWKIFTFILWQKSQAYLQLPHPPRCDFGCWMSCWVNWLCVVEYALRDGTGHPKETTVSFDWHPIRHGVRSHSQPQGQRSCLRYYIICSTCI